MSSDREKAYTFTRSITGEDLEFHGTLLQQFAPEPSFTRPVTPLDIASKHRRLMVALLVRAGVVQTPSERNEATSILENYRATQIATLQRSRQRASPDLSKSPER